MKTQTCKEFIRTIAANNADLQSIKEHYPKGMSVLQALDSVFFDLEVDPGANVIIEHDGANVFETWVTCHALKWATPYPLE